MSHRADDNYIEQFASLVASRLKTDRTAYVEHSNEVWNSIFPQYHYAVQESAARGVPGDDDFQRAMRYHSERSVEIFSIWDDYMPSERLVRVMGGWHTNSWVTGQLLGWQNAFEQTDAFGTAPYFGGSFGVGSNPPQTLMMTAEEIIAGCLDSIEQEQLKTQEQLNAIAAYPWIELAAYESGQHLVGVGTWANNTDLTSLLIEANRHPGMYDASFEDITGWRASGAGLMCAFSACRTPTQWGSWGILEFQDQPIEEAHKMRAWLDLTRNPADLDGNGQVDFFDVTLLIQAFMQVDQLADIDENGSIDFFDVSAFLQQFMDSCS